MVVIGLSGKACAGKNQYADVFSSIGCLCIDVDTLGHQALANNHEKLVSAFGEAIIQGGKVDRKALGAIVFSDAGKLRELERITHPWMVESCKQSIEKARGDAMGAVILNAALLHRMGLDELCDEILFIKAPLLFRYSRCKARERLTFKRFWERESSQGDIRSNVFPETLRVKVFHNIGSLSLIHRQVLAYCGRIGVKVSSNG